MDDAARKLIEAGDYSPEEMQRFIMAELVGMLGGSARGMDRLNIIKELRMCNAGLDEITRRDSEASGKRTQDRLLRARKDNNDAEHIDSLSLADFEQPTAPASAST